MAEAAAQASATNGAPAPAPAAPAAAQNIDDVLSSIIHGDEPLDTEATSTPEAAAEPAEAPAEGEQPEAEPTEATGDETPDTLIFSDEQLSTPEGIRRGRDRAKALFREQQELKQKNYDAYLSLKKYEGRLAKKDTRLKGSISEFVKDKQTHQLLLDNVRSSLQATHSGDPDLMIQGLGQLYGMDGVKALEILNSRLINKGRVPMDPQIQQVIDHLRGQVDELRSGIQQRDDRARAGGLQHQIAEREQGIGRHIEAQAQALPNLHRLYKQDPSGVIKYIADEIVERANAGTPVDGRVYFGNLEQELARAYAQGPAPQGDGGGPAPKQPQQAQRSPGQSVGPHTAARSNPREPSEEEILRSLANDPDLMRSFGL